MPGESLNATNDYIAGTKPHRPIRYYGCSSRRSEKARMLKTACYTPFVLADELKRRVWEVLEAVVYDPGAIIRLLA